MKLFRSLALVAALSLAPLAMSASPVLADPAAGSGQAPPATVPEGGDTGDSYGDTVSSTISQVIANTIRAIVRITPFV